MGCRVETGPESAVVTRLGRAARRGQSVYRGIPGTGNRRSAAACCCHALPPTAPAASRMWCLSGDSAVQRVLRLLERAVQVQGRTLDIRPVRQLQGAVCTGCGPARRRGTGGGRAGGTGDGAALPTPVTSTADMPVLHRCWRNLVPKLSGKCRGKAPARKKHLQKSKIDLHSGQKDDTIQLYKCKQIISVRYAQFYDKIRWRTKLWHSCSMKKWTKTLRRSR